MGFLRLMWTRSLKINIFRRALPGAEFFAMSQAQGTVMRAKIVVVICCSVFLASCETPTPSHWQDATRRGRDSGDFTIDRGQCLTAAQEARYRQQLEVNQENRHGCSGSNGACGALGFLQGMSINSAGEQAFGACMNAHGWVLVPDR